MMSDQRVRVAAQAETDAAEAVPGIGDCGRAAHERHQSGARPAPGAARPRGDGARIYDRAASERCLSGESQKAAELRRIDEPDRCRRDFGWMRPNSGWLQPTWAWVRPNLGVRTCLGWLQTDLGGRPPTSGRCWSNSGFAAIYAGGLYAVQAGFCQIRGMAQTIFLLWCEVVSRIVFFDRDGDPVINVSGDSCASFRHDVEKMDLCHVSA